MISLENVTKEYNLDEQVITPVRNVNLNIEKGKFVIIYGRSGTGKSTLLNLAAGLIKPTAGRVKLGEEYIDQMNDKEISRLRSRKIGYIFQFPSLLSSLSVIENVLVPAMFKKEKQGDTLQIRALEVLGRLGLKGRENFYPRHLSAGEQKRAVIARALMNMPPVLIADEPTSDLDENTEKEIMQYLRQIHLSGMTVLMVTHSLQLIPFADRAYSMENGNLTRVSINV